MNTTMPPVDTEKDQRRLLGDFLRERRGRMDPPTLGLPVTGRRRTAGLRREEVAMLAGISATWLTWLEQGRDIQASPQALDRLARSLRLNAAERAYLFQLSGRRDPRQPDMADDPAARHDRLRAAVAALSVPAYALDHRQDLLAWNQPAQTLFTGWLDQPGPHNLLRYLFLDEGARRLLVDWPARAARVLAEFRADHGRYLQDPGLAALIADLRAGSRDFASRWAAADIRGREGGERLFQHPEQGLLRFRQMTLSVETRPDLRLVMLLPEPEA